MSRRTAPSTAIALPFSRCGLTFTEINLLVNTRSMHISPPEAAPVESVESFRARAEAWIASRVERRPETTSVWGEGDFDVSVFHDVSLDEEKAHLDGLVAWHQAKLDAGFAAITWPTDTGGQGLTGAHERAFAAVEDQ